MADAQTKKSSKKKAAEVHQTLIDDLDQQLSIRNLNDVFRALEDQKKAI